MFSIYILRNKINNKVYIGQTIRSLQRRLVTHRATAKAKVQTKISRAIRKYGKENFFIELLDSCETQKDADELESRYIKMHNSISNGYNISPGGQAIRIVTEETRKKLGNGMRGKNHSLETIGLMSEAHSGENNFFYGKTHTEEVKNFLSKCRRGENTPTAKLSEKDIIVIRELLVNGVKQKDIAIMFGVHNSQISRIKNNKTWSFI